MRLSRSKMAITLALVAVLSIIVVMPAAATGELYILKFYDANANGRWDFPCTPQNIGSVCNPDVTEREQFLSNWMINVNGQDMCIPTTPIFIRLPFDSLSFPVTITERTPIQTNWRATTPTTITIGTIPSGEYHAKFGNVCLGPGGGRTPGFWQGPNGENKFNEMMPGSLAAMQGLNLWVRDSESGAVNPFTPVDYETFRAWLAARNAVDMRYQCSAFLAAMTLNTMAGFVDGDDEIFVGSGHGYIPVDDVMDMANAALADPTSTRNELQIWKNALERACTNQNFVMPDPSSCPYTFAEGTCPLPTV